MEFSYEIKIPKDRIAVLLGTKGEVKKKIEHSLDVKLTIDSAEGDVLIKGQDGLGLMTAQNIVKAIGRGFNPSLALELLNESNYLELIDIGTFSRNAKKDLIRLKSRAIGTGGKARKTIEDLTDTKMVVYGSTIGILGTYEDVDLARKAVESLLSGNRHATVYARLEKQRKNKIMELDKNKFLFVF